MGESGSDIPQLGKEYTALIAACMELKTEIRELLLLHDQTDM